MSDGVLTEAYERFHRTGPEWGADQLTNHGPMAVEVLVRRGRPEVLHALPALPADLWVPSLTAVWAASAAIFAAYAPPEGAAPGPPPPLPAGPGTVAEVLDRAVDHGDEHVIKFTDTAAEVYARTGQPDALAAALRVGALIPSPRD
jgi:hypothetical protein